MGRKRTPGIVTLVLSAVVAAAAASAWAQEVKMGERIDASKFLDPKMPDGGLQRAIDALPKGGMLVLPAGKYVLKRSLMLKSAMTFSGVGPETVITVAPSLPCTTLAADAAKGATAVTVASTQGFEVGQQVTVRDEEKNAWDETFAIITGVKDKTLALDRPLRFDYKVAKKGQVGNLFPAIMGEGRANIVIQFVHIVGPEQQPAFNRFVLSAIHLVKCDNVLITKCLVEKWHSDGISVQGGKNVQVMENISRKNAGHGLHPGTGLQDSFWSGNLSEENDFGLYYCWDNRRVITSHNKFLKNRRYGVGRLGDGNDQDCLVTDNLCERNDAAGIHSGKFGNCKLNFIVGNKILDNCQKDPGAGILLQASYQNVVAKNEIVDDQQKPTQVMGVEEMADGTNQNYIVANVIKCPKDPVLKRGDKTVVENTFPGSIPAERLKLLEDLLQRDAANWAAWQQRTKTIKPPGAPKP